MDEAKKSAAYSLKAFAGIEYGLYKDTRLRDVPASVYDEFRDQLPEVFLQSVPCITSRRWLAWKRVLRLGGKEI